ncbi:MAG: alcohol dehydrogenase catalytic domain-containing protein [Calditrichia bacterium]
MLEAVNREQSDVLVSVETMKALVYYGSRDIRIEHVEKPTPGPNEVLIRVTHAGISQTQVNEFVEGPFVINTAPHPLTGKAVPLIPGHEFGGIIEEVGATAGKQLIGKQVAALPRITCGECRYCRSGKEHICKKIAYIGLLGENGGFAQYAVVPKQNIVEVQDTAAMSFIEPILVGLHAGRVIQHLLPASKVLVMGAGGIGVCLAAVLRDYFRADVTLTDILPNRLARIKKAGFNVLGKNQLKREYDIVIDCAGGDPISQRSAIFEAFDYIYNGGTVLNLGTYFHPLSFVPVTLTVPEMQLRTSFAYDSHDEELLNDALEAIKLDFSELIDKIDFDKLIVEGYFRSEVDKDSFIRLVVQP